jgi:hypothetical protein
MTCYNPKLFRLGMTLDQPDILWPYIFLIDIILKENEIAKKSCMNYLKIIGHQRA